MSFIVIKSGLASQIQDLGRNNSLHLGLSKSGAMDALAFRFNNALLNNAPNAAQIEVAYGNLTLLAVDDCIISIAGAYVDAHLDNKELENYSTHKVCAGEKLFFNTAKYGVFSYIAINGGFDSISFLDSASTTLRLSIGETLKVNDKLRANILVDKFAPIASTVPREYRLNYMQQIIDVIPSYQYQDFDTNQIKQFTSQFYQVSAANRMGARLTADKPIYFSGELISEGIIPGSIQITSQGQPIVLLRDAQSIGGYPKIGVLPDYAISLLAQKIPNKPESKIKFKFVSRKEAKLKQDYLDKLINSFYLKKYR